MKINDTDHYAWQDLALEQLYGAQSVLRAAPEDHHDAKDHRQLALKHLSIVTELIADGSGVGAHISIKEGEHFSAHLLRSSTAHPESPQA